MAKKKVYGWLNSLSVWSSRKKQNHLCSCMKGKKTSICMYLPPKKKKMPPLPSEHLGWNAGKGDCGHYHSHLDFSVHMYNIVVCLHKKYSL